MSTTSCTKKTRSCRDKGFSLVELMVALAIGLVVSILVAGIYLSNRGSFNRLQQLSSLQMKARLAFESLVFDNRLVGYQGCFTGNPNPITNHLDISNNLNILGNQYINQIEGYDYDFQSVSPEFVLENDNPLEDTVAARWSTNIAGSQPTIPLPELTDNIGLAPGSDVLVIRSASGDPERLEVDWNTGNFDLRLGAGSLNSRGFCNDFTTKKVAGFCPNSHILVASCAQAMITTLTATNVVAPQLTTAHAPAAPYNALFTEVFPLRTVAYYVRRGGRNEEWHSLYRRVFDGQNPAGIEQELIEGVESMQLRYISDTNEPLDGIAEGNYQTANMVTDWNKVLAVRMSLWLRTRDRVGGNLPLNASNTANGTTIIYPTPQQFDRRVFTTTVALRNRIQLVNLPPQ